MKLMRSSFFKGDAAMSDLFWSFCTYNQKANGKKIVLVSDQAFKSTGPNRLPHALVLIYLF